MSSIFQRTSEWFQGCLESISHHRDEIAIVLTLTGTCMVTAVSGLYVQRIRDENEKLRSLVELHERQNEALWREVLRDERRL